MGWHLRERIENDEMRQAYQETLIELMRKDPHVVMLDADLGSSSGSTKTFKQFPDQCVNMGISEANMISAGAAMSLTGLTPFAHSFAPFATRRVLDQIYMSLAYSANSLHIYGSEPGYWAQFNGGTHTSIEDIAILNALPNLIITAPADTVSFRWILNHYYSRKGAYYTRAVRKNSQRIYTDDSTFELGKSNVIAQGERVALISVGDMIVETLKAAKILKESGYNPTLVDVFSIKPFDYELIQELASSHALLVVIENHSCFGGVGSIVGTELAKLEAPKARLAQVSINDRFSEVGTEEYLREALHLDAKTIVSTVTSFFEE